MEPRLHALELDSTETANQLSILKDRLQRLEDRFDEITTASDERITELAIDAIDNYDFDDRMDNFLDKSDVVVTDNLETAIKDCIRNELTFEVEVH